MRYTKRHIGRAVTVTFLEGSEKHQARITNVSRLVVSLDVTDGPCTRKCDIHQGTEFARIIENEGSEEKVAEVYGRKCDRGDLEAAFHKVADPKNWKHAINADVVLNDVEVETVRQAVIFFTGSVPTFRPVARASVKRWRYHVSAVGYYSAVGA
jgi:hypothetical protein